MGVFLQKTAGVFKTNLTLNYGVRWDYVTPWAEMHHQTTTLIPGVESQTFPGAPLGYLVPGDHLPMARQSQLGLRQPRKITSRLALVWPIPPIGQMDSWAS